MPAQHCSVCGQMMAEPVSNEAASDYAPPAVATCVSCAAKATTESNRTTIMSAREPLPENEAEGAQPEDAALTSNRAGGTPVIINRKFGNYELINEISRGSFGVVYKARQQGLDRIVALKVLLAGVHASTEAVARFQREARAVARLKHPNVVPIYDIGTFDGHHYFAMEFIEGQPLSTLIARKELSISDSLQIAEALSDAIEAAHRGGVIHRDIKPSNILLDRNRTAHITDFGLAKQVDLDTKYTMSGTTLGTPAYMPPEQARGEIDKIDARSDVYAIGAVLYEMLTGRTPFGGRSLLEVVVAVINEPVKPPRLLNARIHRDIQTIVMKCLEKDPRQRYASAAELRDDLRRFRSGETIKAKPAGFFTIAARFAMRRRLEAGVVVLLITVMISYLVIWKRSHDKELALENKLEQELEKKKPHYVQEFVHPARHNDGKEGLLYDGDEMFSPKTSLFFADRDLRATIVFELSAEGLQKGAQMGLRSGSAGYEAIGYLVELIPGKIRVAGPDKVYNQTPEKIVMVGKAEKDAPELIPGAYKLSIVRAGMELKFRFDGPPEFGQATLEIKDGNLSNWIFKNVQIVVPNRSKRPFPIISVDAGRIYGEEDLKAASDFRVGDYNVAEIELDHDVNINRIKHLKPSDFTAADHIDLATGLYYKGLMQEICNENGGLAIRYYSDAMRELAQAHSENQTSAAAAIKLRHELLARRILVWGHNGEWNYIQRELDENWHLEPPIGEPLAWEFQPIIEEALKDRNGYGPEAALALFKHLGVKPGSARLTASSSHLAGLLADEKSVDGLLALYHKYPSSRLFDDLLGIIQLKATGSAGNSASKTHGPQIEEAIALLNLVSADSLAARNAEGVSKAAVAVFREALKLRKFSLAAKLFAIPLAAEKLCDELPTIAARSPLAATADYDAFIAELLIPAATQLKSSESALAKLWTATETLARTFTAASPQTFLAADETRSSPLVRMHEALRGGQALDSRMAAVFAEAISALNGVREENFDPSAAALLNYCADHVARDDQKIHNATLALLQKLQEQRLSRLTLLFYSRARLVYRNDGPALMRHAINALDRSISAQEQDEMLKLLWSRIHTELEQKSEMLADYDWRLEYGDILLAINRWQEARDIYQALLETPKLAADLVGKAGLRLLAMNIVQPWTIDPRDVSTKLTSADKPEEIRLAANLLMNRLDVPLDTLDVRMTEVRAPLLLSERTWKLLRALRLRLDGKGMECNKLCKTIVLNEDHPDHPRDWVETIASVSR